MANTIQPASTARTYKVGIIIGSQRVRRAGPQITDFVADTIKQHHAASRASSSSPDAAAGPAPEIAFELIDVAALDLPLFDEPGVPSKILDPAGYAHEHTRAWSARVAALDAFVFVTPQYNWGVPAGLKNAIDYLFHEWKGKPAMVVSYGGHGGDKCAAALALVLGGGIGVRVVEKTVNLSFPSREFLVMAATGKPLGLDAAAEDGTWADKKAEIVEVWDELVKMLGTPAF